MIWMVELKALLCNQSIVIKIIHSSVYKSNLELSRLQLDAILLRLDSPK